MAGGLFWQHIDRHYGQDLPTPGYDALSTFLGYPTSVQLAAPPDTRFTRTSNISCGSTPPSARALAHD